MSRLWKEFRTNMMYWRFRHITRNRLRLKSWWSRRRATVRPPAGFVPRSSPIGRRPQGYQRPFERGLAGHVQYGGSRRQSFAAFAALIVLMTALSAVAHRVFISPGIVYGIGTLIIVGSVYYALKGV